MKHLKDFGLWLLQALIGIFMMGLLFVMLVEWSAGCGETYVDAKGVRHQHECLFIKGRAK
jgi:hypothetical protein